MWCRKLLIVFFLSVIAKGGVWAGLPVESYELPKGTKFRPNTLDAVNAERSVVGEFGGGIVMNLQLQIHDIGEAGPVLPVLFYPVNKLYHLLTDRIDSGWLSADKPFREQISADNLAKIKYTKNYVYHMVGNRAFGTVMEADETRVPARSGPATFAFQSTRNGFTTQVDMLKTPEAGHGIALRASVDGRRVFGMYWPAAPSELDLDDHPSRFPKEVSRGQVPTARLLTREGKRAEYLMWEEKKKGDGYKLLPPVHLPPDVVDGIENSGHTLYLASASHDLSVIGLNKVCLDGEASRFVCQSAYLQLVEAGKAPEYFPIEGLGQSQLVAVSASGSDLAVVTDDGVVHVQSKDAALQYVTDAQGKAAMDLAWGASRPRFAADSNLSAQHFSGESDYPQKGLITSRAISAKRGTLNYSGLTDPVVESATAVGSPYGPVSFMSYAHSAVFDIKDNVDFSRSLPGLSAGQIPPVEFQRYSNGIFYGYVPYIVKSSDMWNRKSYLLRVALSEDHRLPVDNRPSAYDRSSFDYRPLADDRSSVDYQPLADDRPSVDYQLLVLVSPAENVKAHGGGVVRKRRQYSGLLESLASCCIRPATKY